MLCLTSMTTNSGCDADPLVSDNEARDLIQRDAKTMHLAFRGLLTSRHYVVQTGVFDVEENARAMAAALEKAGIEWHIKER